MKLSPLVGGMLVVLCLLCYARATGGPFLFDDIGGIVENEFKNSLTPLSRALDAPPGTGADGRPLVAISLALNHAFGGDDPFGYHLFNLALHALTGLMLFAFARRALARCKTRIDPTLAATMLAALWMVHPIHTASLHHIIQRSGVLMTLFYLCTLYAAARGFESPRPRRWFALSIMACALGAAAKESIVTAPVVVLLYDRTFFSGSLREAWRRHRSLYLGLAATWILLALIVSTGSRSPTVGFDIDRCTPLDYLRTQSRAILLYLRLSLWPDRLSFDYGNYTIVRAWGDVVLEGASVLVLVGLALYGSVKKRAWGWVAISMFLILAPTTSFIPLSRAIVAEHRMYLPLAGLIVLAGIALERALGGRAVISVALLAFALSCGTTWRRNEVFQDGLTVWEDTVQKRPENARAWAYYASALRHAQRDPEAEVAYAKAIEAVPDFFMPHVNLGNLLYERGDLAGAEPLFARAAELRPSDANTRCTLGLIQLARGRTPDGIRNLRAALALDLDPRLRTSALRELAWVLATSRVDALRDGEEALRLAEELAGDGPPRPRRLAILAAAQAEVGRFEAATETARRALKRARDADRPGLVPSLQAQTLSYGRREPWRE